MNKRIAPSSIIFLLLMSVFLLQAKNGAGQGRKFFEEWRKDTTGCNGFRNDSTVTLLIENMAAKKMNEEKTKQLLGTPNFTFEADGKLNFAYYYDVVCKQGEIINPKDYHTCAFEFTKSGKYAAAFRKITITFKQE